MSVLPSISAVMSRSRDRQLPPAADEGESIIGQLRHEGLRWFWPKVAHLSTAGDCCAAGFRPQLMTAVGLVSRALPVHTAMRNCTRDEGGPFEFGNQVPISSHRKLLRSKGVVVSVAETSGHDPGRHG